MTEYNRQTPLFERSQIPFEVFQLEGCDPCRPSGVKNHSEKKISFYTLRILEGRRPIPNQNHSGTERAIRLEISDECSQFVRHCSRENETPQLTNDLKSPHKKMQHLLSNPCALNTSIMMQNPQNLMDDLNPSTMVNSRPIHLFELEVGETDFCELRRDLALLVDFPDFASSFISLLQFCNLGESENGDQRNVNFDKSHEENKTILDKSYNHENTLALNANNQCSKYSCRLEIGGINKHYSRNSDGNSHYTYKKNSNPGSITSRFSIVESNQFRELSHLTLNLMQGTDASIRSYLSSRLTQTMNQNLLLKQSVQKKISLANSAEYSSKETSAKLNQLLMTSETEKRELKLKWNERLQQQSKLWEEKYKKLEEQTENKKQTLIKETEIKLKCTQEKLDKTHKENQKLTQQIFGLESRVEKIQHSLDLKNENIELLNKSVTSLTNKLNSAGEENKLLEKTLHQRELQVAALEKSNESQEKVMRQLEDLRDAAQNSTIQAKSSVDEQTIEIHELKNRLVDFESKEKKSNEIFKKFQRDRTGLKTKITRYIQIIKKQEQNVIEMEKEITFLKNKNQEITKKEQEIKQDKAKKEKEIKQLMDKVKEAEKVIESNQQVISWLNREVSEAQLGRGRPIPCIKTAIKSEYGDKLPSFSLRKNKVPTAQPKMTNGFIYPASKNTYASSFVTPHVSKHQQTSSLSQH